jgi:WD40 repeat protein
MNRCGSIFVLLVYVGDCCLAAAPRTETRQPSKIDLTRKAMEILKTECFACHNEEKKKGRLVLTSREAVLKGNDEGVVVVQGKPEASRLARALLADADPHMPPKKQLTESQIKVLRDWIKRGVVWDEKALAEDGVAVMPVELAALPASYQPVMALALSPDGNRLAVGRGGSVVVYDVSRTNFPVLALLNAHRDAVQALAWSADGHWLASGAFRRVVLWNTEGSHVGGEWTNGLRGCVTGIEFAPDGRTLALADGVTGQSGYLRLIDTTEGKIAASWRAHGDTIFDLEFSRDGTQLVTAGGDKLIKVWELASKKEVARLEGHTAQVLSVAFNTNATQVVSGGADKGIKVWDIKTREKIISLGGHSATVTSVAWPGDGTVIVAATDKGLVSAYTNLKAHTGEQSSNGGDEKKIGDANETVTCMAVARDAKTFFAGSHEGVVHVWNSEKKVLGKLIPATNSIDFSSATTLKNGPPRSSKRVSSDSNSELRTAISTASSPRLLQIGRVLSLTAEPKTIRLSADAPRHGVLISAQTADGFDVDVTDRVKFSTSRLAPFEVGELGQLRVLRPGEGTLIASFARHRVEIPVSIKASTGGDGNIPSSFEPPPVSFLRDVLPALSKAGCNAGACHAKAEGQNGFKLSVFSYDPKSDYEHIVKDARGRRVFPAAPDESLIIKKPTTTIPHEGGLRFERGSETHRLLVRWLREGMAYSAVNEPALQRLVVFPKERRYHKGATQRLLVQARYSDGSIRDITRLAAFDSNDKEVATVDEQAVVTVGTLTGQGAVVARYAGLVADAHITVPADRLLPEAQYAALPHHNFIDELAYAQFQRLGLLPSELCTDTEFLRRASLDAIGVLPTPDEVREFLAECARERSSGAVEKWSADSAGAPGLQHSNTPLLSSSSARLALIDRLLARPEFGDYWANKWADLLRPNPDRVGVKSVFTLDQWLRDSFRQNKPYDQFVREILLSEGTNHRDGPTVVYRDRREPADLTTLFSQLFLGTRLECARCHHHPNEKWSQDDFYQLAAFFGSVKQKGAGLSPPISAGTETFYFAAGGSVKHPVTGAVMSPRPPDAPSAPPADGTDPRRALADWLIAPDNPFFARAAVNRVWAAFFGRGLVEPVDDFRISNPCVNPPLLDALADDFAKHGYDLKHLMRTILDSRLYQLSSIPNETNLRDTRNFSRAYRRRLPAEVLLDAVDDATGVPDTFAATPVGARATQVWSYKIESQFMDAFNRPNPSSDPPCERDKDLSVVQSLHLMNSKALQAKLSHANGRAHKLAESGKPPSEIVTELYLTTLSRPPTDEESQIATAAFNAPDATRQSATEDVFWALLNSAEFVFNH